MKKIPLIFLLVLIVFTTNAQIGKHAVLAGIDFNVTSSTQDFYNSLGTKLPDKNTTTHISFVPNIGLFLGERFLVGANVNFMVNKVRDHVHGYPGFSPTTTDKSVTAYARHYTKAGERLYFFVQGDLTWGTESYESERTDNLGNTVPYTDVNHFFRGGVRPGIVYFVSPRLGLESTLGFFGYTRTYANNDNFNTQQRNITNTLGFALNPSTINFGFRFYLGKRPAAS